MSAINWRGVLIAGLSLAAIATPVAAQERELLTLEAALARAGIVDSADEPPENPRLIGPRAEADAARALVDQARLRQLVSSIRNKSSTGKSSTGPDDPPRDTG